MREFISMVLLFFLVTDPIGNLPLFIATLNESGKRYRTVVIRESCIALGMMIVFLLGGGMILEYLNLSQASLELAGGIVLFLIAIKMVFGGTAGSHSGKDNANQPDKEPFIVPLAIPFIAGPATLSTCILLGGNDQYPQPLILSALVVAWLGGTLILLSGRWAARVMGPKLLSALEALMGLLLVAMSAEMLIRGIKMAFNV